MVVSLAGFAGACYRNTFLLRFYLVVMFCVIGVLIGFIIFAYVVTDKGSGRRVMNRGYLDYYLEDYSGWLEERVASDEYWGKISSCIRDSKACRKLARNFNDVPETADMFFERKLNPIQVCSYIRISLLFLCLINDIFFYGGRSLNLGSCIYYALFLSTELNSRGRFFLFYLEETMK